MVTTSAMGNFVAIQQVGASGALGNALVLWADRGDGIAAPSHLGTVTVAGVTYLIVASAQSSSLTTMRITSDGTLVPTDHVVDELTTRFSGTTALETVMLDGRALVFVGGRDDGISVFTLMPDGRLLHLATLEDRGDRTLADVSAISATVIDGKIALFVSSSSERGITHLIIGGGPCARRGSMLPGPMCCDSDLPTCHAGAGTTELGGGAGDDILIAGMPGSG
ncbi:hypothetical protein DPM13_05610 [Paracoccus mutanolyticus]|uniref:Uncharacterized protein n=1 Tax=Paracoccus mutanolyticus TaxID=1499308 RepID=A0ABN5M8Z8_9RHOB|nr:hypothetical protein [Paracoccus mutanolyticus]AWX92825.1 hypothetical protein DPM13_05610 [Paracoccus mutanolyticus]